MKPVSSKLPDEVADRLDEYAEEHDLTRSKGIRDLIGTGLESYETYDTITLPTVLGLSGLYIFIFSHVEMTFPTVIGNIGAIMMLIALLTQYRPLHQHIKTR